MKLGWLRHMGQSVDSGFKATAVPTWGPRIPPAIGNSAVLFLKSAVCLH